MKIANRTFVISGGEVFLSIHPSLPPFPHHPPKTNIPHRASGLGLSTARTIIQNGGNVQILDLNPTVGKALIDQLGGPQRANFTLTDVGDSAQIALAVRETKEWIERTGKTIGGIVAAAGVARPGTVMGMDRQGMRQFDEVMRINVRGTVDLVRYFLPLLATCPLPAAEEEKDPNGDGERGVIILVSSAAAFDGQPGQVAYAASKGAIASLTLPLTREVARYGIRVVTIAPGLFETAMTTNISKRLREGVMRVLEFPKRAGRPEEFARLVKEGLENSMLNGVVMRLDGGVRLPSKF